MRGMASGRRSGLIGHGDGMSKYGLEGGRHRMGLAACVDCPRNGGWKTAENWRFNPHGRGVAKNNGGRTHTPPSCTAFAWQHIHDSASMDFHLVRRNCSC